MSVTWGFVARLTALAACAISFSVEGAGESFRVAVPGGEVVVVIGPEASPVPREAIVHWIENSARAIAAVFGRFGVPEARLDLRTGRRGRIGSGRTDDFVAHVSIRLGNETTPADLASDWVLTHEFVHLATPTLSRRYAWFMEGGATYVEPFARARVGLLDADALWEGLLEGMPNGLPGKGDGGLDVTHSWGRTYWGGALFFLLADLEIRERSKGRRSLDDAFRGMLAKGGDVRADWTLEDALSAADEGVGEGLNVLTRLHAEQGHSPVAVDLDALFRRLGVSRAGGRVVTDDAAPLASIRRALSSSVPPAAPKGASPRGTDPRTNPGGE
jgi:hypothetical protein